MRRARLMAAAAVCAAVISVLAIPAGRAHHAPWYLQEPCLDTETVLLVKALWRDSWVTAMDVIWHESDCLPDAKSPRSSATGLFQQLDAFGREAADLLGWEPGWDRTHPLRNIVAAYTIWSAIENGGGNGWRRWGVCDGPAEWHYGWVGCGFR